MPPSSPPSEKPGLPAASIEALGCLFLPGCAGALIVAIVCLVYAVQAGFAIEAWINGRQAYWFNILPGARDFAWPIFSAAAYEAIRRGNRRPWLYWATALCLAGWIFIASTRSPLLTIDYPGSSEADQQFAGRVLSTAVAAFIFLRFTLSRKNRLYFSLARPKDLPQ
jgi:hypothetical protein